MVQTIYDIVKAHGGELKVETKEARPATRAGKDGDDPRLNDSVGQAVGQGVGSEFIIMIPVSINPEI